MSHVHGSGGAPQKSDRTAGRRSTWLVRVLIFVVLGAGIYYLVAEHAAHLSSVWLLLFLLACPLMHMLHGGHGRHSAHDQKSSNGGGDA